MDGWIFGLMDGEGAVRITTVGHPNGLFASSIAAADPGARDTAALRRTTQAGRLRSIILGVEATADRHRVFTPVR